MSFEIVVQVSLPIISRYWQKIPNPLLGPKDVRPTDNMIEISKHHPTYQTNTLPKSCAYGKCVENLDCSPEGSRHFTISPSKFCHVPNLLLENVHDRVNRMTILELLGERMIDQLQPCLSVSRSSARQRRKVAEG
jgi:hypothetical protein